jgi:hypothetical protein
MLVIRKGAIIAPHEDQNRKSKMSYAIQGAQQMRGDQPIREEAEAVGFNFHFQIGNGSDRKACSISVQAHNYHEATDLFRRNWPTIEAMARKSLSSSAAATEIKLRMP